MVNHIQRLVSVIALSGAMLYPVAGFAQSTPQQAAQVIDDLIVCTIIYNRTSELYLEKADAENGQSFQETSYAYGMVADVLIDQTYSEAIALTYYDERMETMMKSLNNDIPNHPNGELGVIDQWLGYCDGMGSMVQTNLNIISQQNL